MSLNSRSVTAGNIKTKSNMQSGATYHYGAGNAGLRRDPSTGEPGYGGAVSVDVLREELPWIQEQCKARGKPPLDLAMSSGPPLNILPKSKRSGRRTRDELQFFTCEGTIDELLEEFVAYKEAGATSFVVNFPATGVEDYLGHAETFAREFMPALA